MIYFNNVKHIYVACGFTDLRKGIDGYASIANGKLALNPFDNTLFLFCNKFKNKIKILHFEAGSFWLYYKRVERITIKWPVSMVGIEITKDQVKGLINGLKLESFIKKW